MSVNKLSQARGKSLLVLSAVTLAGCLGHVHVPQPPSASAPLATRQEYYDNYRVEREEVGTRMFSGGPGRSSSGPAALGFRLANGTLVRDAQDIAHVVDSQSMSGVALTRARGYERTSTPLLVSATIASLVGWSLLTVGILQGYGFESVRIVGATLGTAGVLGLGFDLFLLDRPAVRERERAMVLFNDSLRDRLGLCGDGTHIGDCASATPPASDVPSTTGSGNSDIARPPWSDSAPTLDDNGAAPPLLTPDGNDTMDNADAGP